MNVSYKDATGAVYKTDNAKWVDVRRDQRVLAGDTHSYGKLRSVHKPAKQEPKFYVDQIRDYQTFVTGQRENNISLTNPAIRQSGVPGQRFTNPRITPDVYIPSGSRIYDRNDTVETPMPSIPRRPANLKYKDQIRAWEHQQYRRAEQYNYNRVWEDQRPNAKRPLAVGRCRFCSALLDGANHPADELDCPSQAEVKCATCGQMVQERFFAQHGVTCWPCVIQTANN
jgi:hypothetical protein